MQDTDFDALARDLLGFESLREDQRAALEQLAGGA